MHLLHVVGARPNFMKAAPLLRALSRFTNEQTLVHSGQHYDHSLSGIFFEQLAMRAPDFNLQVGSGTHAEQTAMIMSRFEPVLLERSPTAVIVYGDVNSTVAATLVCSKLHIPVLHIEAGLRSGDRSMPEEINRVVTDQLAELLFTPSNDADQNLLREGIAPDRIHLVGNIMIDTLIHLLPEAERVFPLLAMEHALRQYGLVTLHRPSTVDDPEILLPLLRTLDRLAADLPLLFPVHPRTKKQIAGASLELHHLRLVDPLSYVEFLALQQRAELVITDSGGIQEETTYLGIPCLTFRENTERPITVQLGTNVLTGLDCGKLEHAAGQVLRGNRKRGVIPPLWDGRTAARIANIVQEHYRDSFCGFEVASATGTKEEPHRR